MTSTTTSGFTTTVSPVSITSAPILTTTFTAASSCLTDVYVYAYSDLQCVVGTSVEPCLFYHLGQDSSTSDCLPTGWTDATGAYFSPGICPVGFGEACSLTVSLSSGFETRATCCPSGFACQTETSWPWYTTDLCTSRMITQGLVVYTTSVVGKGLVTITTTDQAGVNAFGVVIRYQSTDFMSTTSSVTSTHSGTMTTGASTTTASSTVPSEPINPGTNSGLSNGAKAGIGVGVVLGVLAALGVVAFLIVRRRRRRAPVGVLPPADQSYHKYPNTPYISEVAGSAYTPPAELSAGR